MSLVVPLVLIDYYLAEGDMHINISICYLFFALFAYFMINQSCLILSARPVKSHC